MYIDEFDVDYISEDVYDRKKKEREVRPVFLKEEIFQPEIEKEIKVRSRIATPSFEETKIEDLRTLGPKVIGSLFDRVDFLRERINENKESSNTRKKLHEDMVKEIDDDIKEKKDIESHLTDVDEKRNFKLDMSNLRREKRHEQVQFWRDLLELNTELKEVLQEYQMESKILEIFKGLEGGRDAGY